MSNNDTLKRPGFSTEEKHSIILELSVQDEGFASIVLISQQ